MIATSSTLHQVGVIAYRTANGKVRVLMMTSRDTGRWIIPKGNIDAGVPPCEAAKREAYEEAGVKGAITSPIPIGFYTYFKKLASGEARPTRVEVYLLHVTQQVKKWPERGERKLCWVSARKAVGLVEEPGLIPLLLRFRELEDDLAKPEPEPSRDSRSERHV